MSIIAANYFKKIGATISTRKTGDSISLVNAVNEFSTDVTLAGDSDIAIPTEHAVKTYVDSQVGLENYWDRAVTTLTTHNAGDNVTIDGTLKFATPFTLGLISVTTTGTRLNYLNAATGTTGTTSTNLVFSASPTFTGTVVIPTPFTIGAVSMTTTGTQLNYLNAATGTTGTTNTSIVFSTSPNLTTPTITGLLTANGGIMFTGLLYRNGATTSDVSQINLGTSCTTGSTYSTVGGGQLNSASAFNSIVGGGYSNSASNTYASVCGGQSNTASGLHSTSGGGLNNLASGRYGIIAGGNQNTASGLTSTICGGYLNTANGADSSTIGGGAGNTASGSYSTVAGGNVNTASGNYSFIGGGQSNIAGIYSFVGGGYANEATGSYSVALGMQAKASHAGCFLFADGSAADLASTANNQFLIRVAGGFKVIGTSYITGYAGFGITPSYPMHISSGTQTTEPSFYLTGAFSGGGRDAFRVVNSSSASYCGLVLQSGSYTSEISTVATDYATAYLRGLWLYNANEGIILEAAGGSGTIKFNTGGASSANERMRIAADGKVGIGTASPQRGFHIYNSFSGEIAWTADGAPAGSKNVQWQLNPNGNLYFQMINDGWSAVQQYLVFTRSGNLAVNTATLGTNAVSVLGLATGTAPADNPADTIQIYSTDVSAGNCVLAWRQEMAPYAGIGIASTDKIPVKVNGTTYYILATTVA